MDHAEGRVEVALWDNDPSKGTAEKPPDHPEGGLNSEVRSTVLVTDEL